MTTPETLQRQETESSTKDLDRFRQFLTQGSPGPYAHVVLLGLEIFDSVAVFRALRKGFSYRSFDRFRRNTSLPVDSLIDLVAIPRRTLTRRKREGRFLPEESDRLLRASRLFGRTLELFEGDRDAAAEWLTAPQAGLGGAVPLDVAGTDAGAREVERIVGRLEHGVFS